MSATQKWVIFDFDGTLVDSAPDFIEAVQRLLAANDLPRQPDDLIRSHIGYGLVNLLTQVLNEAGAQDADTLATTLFDQFYHHFEMVYLNQVGPFGGAIDFVKNLSLPCSILSNKSEKFLLPTVTHLGMDQLGFEATCGGDTFGQRKPDPITGTGLAGKVNRDIKNAIMVGDGVPDAQLAKALNIPFVAVGWGYAKRNFLQDCGVTSFAETFDELHTMIHSYC